METSLQIEKEWRTAVQASYEQEKEKLAQTQMEIVQLRELKRVSQKQIFVQYYSLMSFRIVTN